MWALQFDGVNDQAKCNLISNTSGDFSITVDVILKSAPSNFGTFASIANAGGTEFLGLSVDSARRPKILSSGKTPGTGSTLLIVDQQYELKLEYISATNTANYYINNVFEYSVNPTNGGTWIPNLNVLRFGADGVNVNNANYQLIAPILIDNGAEQLSFSPDASDHSNTGQQPVLVDTVGGNNAIGVNMPTDGSAWVDLGGGGVTGNLNLTLDDVLSISSGQAGDNATGTIILTLNNVGSNSLGHVGLDVSGSMSETLDNVGFTSSGQVGDDVSGTILYTLDDGVSNSSGQVGSDAAGSINYILDDDVMTASGTVAVSVTGTINYNLEGDTMNAFGIGGEDESLFTSIQLIPIQLTSIQLKQIVLITN